MATASPVFNGPRLDDGRLAYSPIPTSKPAAFALAPGEAEFVKESLVNHEIVGTLKVGRDGGEFFCGKETQVVLASFNGKTTAKSALRYGLQVQVGTWVQGKSIPILVRDADKTGESKNDGNALPGFTGHNTAISYTPDASGRVTLFPIINTDETSERGMFAAITGPTVKKTTRVVMIFARIVPRETRLPSDTTGTGAGIEAKSDK